MEIELDGVERSFGERRVLKGISASLKGGDRLLVRGPNGSGKSTLLKIVAGILTPTGGSVRVVQDGGRPAEGADRRRMTGYLAPDLVLYEEFSSLENLDFFGRVRGLGRDRARDQALLERVGLGRRGEDPVGTLSTGMRQRAKVAFALQAAPRILIFDEPGSNLDEPGRRIIAEAVEAQGDQEGIVIIASNDPAEFGLGNRTLDLA